MKYIKNLTQCLVHKFTMLDAIMVKMAESEEVVPAVTTRRRAPLDVKDWSWCYNFNHPPTQVSTFHLSVCLM